MTRQAEGGTGGGGNESGILARVDDLLSAAPANAPSSREERGTADLINRSMSTDTTQNSE